MIREKKNLKENIFSIKLFFRYFVYLLTAKSNKGYGIHSPFLYKLSTAVLSDKRSFKEFDEIKRIRALISSSNELISSEEFGAGSKFIGSKKRTVGNVVKVAATKPKYGELLFRMVRFFQPENIVEFGTSLGIGTLYLAMAAPNAKIVTIEGSKELALKSEELFYQQGLKNVLVKQGDFRTVLESSESLNEKVDFVYFDGGHTREMTIYLFEKMLQMKKPSTILVFDDIRWSSEMEEAWRIIVKDPRVTLSLDLFWVGIVFFRGELAKQHICIKY